MRGGKTTRIRRKNQKAGKIGEISGERNISLTTG